VAQLDRPLQRTSTNTPAVPPSVRPGPATAPAPGSPAITISTRVSVPAGSDSPLGGLPSVIATFVQCAVGMTSVGLNGRDGRLDPSETPGAAGAGAYAGLVWHDSGPVSAAEFRALYAEVATWTRWRGRPERGALNYLTPERIVAATRLVRTGQTVSLAVPLDTEEGPANPQPAEHYMTQMPADDIGFGTVRFAKDYIGVDFHNDGHSHIDALSHVVYENKLYDGLPDDSITEAGAHRASIELLRDGLVGRGVLLDIPALRGVDWLETGDQVRPEELEAAEQRQGVRVGTGDVLLVRIGHGARLAALAPWDPAHHKAGLHPTVARFLADRQVAALGSDGNSDAVPSTTEGVGFPIHVLAINAMGLCLMDYLAFERLTEACAAHGRWEFLVVVAPLRITGGTGSPVNPIAIF